MRFEKQVILENLYYMPYIPVCEQIFGKKLFIIEKFVILKNIAKMCKKIDNTVLCDDKVQMGM